ncbi:crossover junction endonuclease EME1 isoform X3 [Procambarus clarkii]|uniref:crossover junction endonuclease EME1 isoform X3 n=1 Tax=Procambarus clarkii TaxID=6728 RepID=UPI001E671246|nr:crossover junction endonuclease EME1-like isoform X3 [Procambarus clarkii]XP_045623201.1 crossover junction endonuclease EME1-like isoform X3 [Procambarus clarkii]XP_045623202.1 crossover junction endonuclease EME1-like isoform X3 [Procambarus clarkii]
MIQMTAFQIPDDFDEELPDIHEFTLLEPCSRATGGKDLEMREKNAVTTCHPKKKLRLDNPKEDKEAKRIFREAEKQRRATEKAEAKAQKEAEKASKRAMKPGECMKHVIVQLDRQLLELAEGSQVISHLQTAEVRYRVIDSPVPTTVTILRVDPLTLQETQAEEAVVVIPISDFIELIKQQVYEDGMEGLCHQCRLWKRKLNGANLTLVVCSVDEYLRSQKTGKQQNFRSAVLGQTTKPAKGRKKKSGSEFPTLATTSVSRVDIETALVTAQLECGLNHRLLEDANKVASFILQVTKAVAETPFKREKGETTFSWYAEGNNTNTVKIDRSGVGLLKLWHQQLRQFNNVGVEVAQAIAREHPSPQILLESYRKCQTFREASLLLADIPVRRGAGPLASTRRIGPELSKKIHLFFTTTDPEANLAQT